MRTLICIIIPMLALGGCIQVYAEDGSANGSELDTKQSEESPIALERIRVTGYHIKRIDIEGPAPVQIIDGNVLQRAGFNSLQDIVRNLPLSFAPPPDIWYFMEGGTHFDLRGLGPDATLVLVNGLRIASEGSANDAVVDVDAIPLSAIERIEILKDGASAIYGADAIAGVVNIILRRDFEGVEASAGWGSTTHGDGEETVADLVAGYASARGNILFSLSYYKREPILAGDRAWSAEVDFRDRGGQQWYSFYSSPPTFLRYDSFSFEPDPACGSNPELTTVLPDSPWGPEWGSSCGFNYAPYTYLLSEHERWSGTVSGRYEVNGGLALFGDLLISKSEIENRNAPAPLSGSAQLETWFGNPYVPAEHPYNPFGTEGEMYGRALDAGSRVYRNETTAWRAVIGAEGLWGAWDWRTSLLLARNEFDGLWDNMVSKSRMQLALLGQGGPGGDQWYNPFGADPQNDPLLLEWLKARDTGSTTNDERSIDLEISRSVGMLPGGPAALAVGLQYRRQERDERIGDLLQSYDLAGVGSGAPVSADRDITSAYMEFSLPVLQSVEAQLAARFEHYSDFGSTTNPKIALSWRPVSSLMLRGSWSTSFLPPNFNELFLPAVEGRDYFFDSVRCDLTGSDLDCSWREYTVDYHGNADLDAEKGESWFAGMVWAPGFLPGFELELDWWKFEHRNRIVDLSPQVVLDRGGDEGIIRQPTGADGMPGPIIRVEETFHNFEKLVTQGFDTALHYRRESKTAGTFSITLLHSYIDEWTFKNSIFDWAVGENEAGWYWDSPIPRNRADLDLSWDRGPQAATAKLHYTGHYRNFTDQFVDGELTDQPWIIGSYTTLDLQYSYAFEGLKRARLRIGCTNCTDEEPPYRQSNSPEPFHDARGRYYYLRWEQPIR